MTHLAAAQPVRLTLEQRAEQPEIGDLIGLVIHCDAGVVEVHWPRFRSWHRVDQLEAVER
jgi:hypothetical protein